MKLWKGLTSRDRRALGLGAMAVIPALALGGVVKPYLRMRAALVERLREQRDLLHREMAIVAAAHDLPVNLKGAARVFARARCRLLPERDALGATAGLVSLVGDDARRHGVLLEGIESGVPEPVRDDLIGVQIGVRGRGDLEGLMRWLKALESGTRLLRVERLSVDRPEQAVGRDSLDVETLVFSATIRAVVLVGSAQ